jgi:D-glycero-D-manno-heptose 1,7-bisphosphate phosphatase
MRLIVLDRDGVINEDSPAYIKSAGEWTPIPGSLEAIARLNHAGYRVVVTTNQSGLARGLLTVGDLHAIHQKMYRLLSLAGGHVEAIFFCPHAPADCCRCRKPRAGLLQEVAARFHISLEGVPAVGDSRRDLEAARTMDATPILVRTGKGEQTLSTLPPDHGIAVFPDLASLVSALLNAGT